MLILNFAQPHNPDTQIHQLKITQTKIPSHLPNQTDFIPFAAQLEAMSTELARRREECLQLRTVLASMSRQSLKGADKRGGMDTSVENLNEDGELEMAYKTQKDLNK